MTESFPLSWPPGWPRTPTGRRCGTGADMDRLVKARDEEKSA